MTGISISAWAGIIGEMSAWVRRQQRALSARVHAAGDERARSHGWTVTETTGRFGFGARIYRDPRFGAPRPALPAAHAVQQSLLARCVACGAGQADGVVLDSVRASARSRPRGAATTSRPATAASAGPRWRFRLGGLATINDPAGSLPGGERRQWTASARTADTRSCPRPRCSARSPAPARPRTRRRRTRLSGCTISPRLPTTALPKSGGNPKARVNPTGGWGSATPGSPPFPTWPSGATSTWTSWSRSGPKVRAACR